MLESGPIQAQAIQMPRLRPEKFLCVSSQLEDACADTGQRIGGDPPIPRRLIGAFFPMLEWSEENRENIIEIFRIASGRGIRRSSLGPARVSTATGSLTSPSIAPAALPVFPIASG